MTHSVTTHQRIPSAGKLLLGIWGHLGHRRKLQTSAILLIMLVSGLAELLSLGAVLPFLALLSDPQRLWEQPIIQELAIEFGVTSASQLLLPSTLFFASAAVLAALIRLSNLWLNGRLAAAVGSDLSCEAYRRTLYQPYEVHVQRSSSEVIAGITQQIDLTVLAINNLLQFLTSAVVATGLVIGLLMIDAPVALGASALFGISYGMLTLKTRRYLLSNGQKIAEASTQQLKALQEGLGAIRDVLLDGSQLAYLQIYRQADRPKRQRLSKNIFLAYFPRYVFEAMGMVGIALLGGFLVLQRGNAVAVIPLLGALALGAQRLLPALQQIYSGWSSVVGYSPAMNAVLNMLSQPLAPIPKTVSSFPLKQNICLNDVCFKYENDQSLVLQGVNLEIRRGESIGFIGSTGSGKTTTIDVIMGLLKPISGKVMVDGLDLHDPEYPDRLIAWRSSIAHVPQSVYLADSSIAENIAFGVPKHEIDLSLVKQAAAGAQIANFIESNLDGYASFVGERGIRLSGGQRQRIGIARALYKKARVLVLDEATSALDIRTEERVMSAVHELSKSLTVIMIAHRLSTVERCDRVIRLEQGSVSADGPPHLVLSSQA